MTSGVVMAQSPALPTGGGTEEVTRKREVRLMKNRYVGNLHQATFVYALLKENLTQIFIPNPIGLM